MERIDDVLTEKITALWRNSQSWLQNPAAATMCFEAPKLQTVPLYQNPSSRTSTISGLINRQLQCKETVCSIIDYYLPKRRIKKTYSTRRLEFHRDSLFEHCNLSIEKCRIVSATWQAEWIDNWRKVGWFDLSSHPSGVLLYLFIAGVNCKHVDWSTRV